MTGLDTNVLCYLMDPAFPEHSSVSRIFRSLSSEFKVAINPTSVHEVYHTLVYDQRWVREDARTRLGMLLRHPYIEFYNQTKSISVLAMSLAERYKLGGRDSLILANFLANDVNDVYTHDRELLKLGQIEWRSSRMRMIDPVK